jgi:esterase
MASDLDEFMRQHGISPASVLGHSMGGKTAMQFALTYPDKTEKLVVVDIAPRAYNVRHDEILDALSSLDLSRHSTRKQVDTALATMIGNKAVRQFLLKNLGRTESGEFTWKLNLEIIRKRYSDIADWPSTARHVFTKPTLFVKGEQSSYIQNDDHRRIIKLFPNATVVTVEGAGHWVHADASPEFSRIVGNFLNAS